MKAFKIKNGLQAGRYLGSNGTETTGSVGYNLAGASYDSKSFNISTQDTAPHCLTIKSDGTKLFVVGNQNGNVYEYTLSTAYDISSASFSSSFSVYSQDTVAKGLFVKADGTRFYFMGPATDKVYQYSMTTAWDISTASYDSKFFLVRPQETGPQSLWFKTDGSKMYVLGQASSSVFQYSLSTAWDISTASYDSVSYSVSSLGSSACAVAFNDDGSEMYTTTSSNPQYIRIHTLQTPWDISTASNTGFLDTSTSISASVINGISFADAGQKMYFSQQANDSIYQYSTVGYTQALDLSTGTTFSFTPSGTTTVSLTNPPATGIAIGFTVEIIGDASAITWPSSVKWPAGVAPTATATKELYTFVTTDGGTTYYGKKAAEGIS